MGVLEFKEKAELFLLLNKKKKLSDFVKDHYSDFSFKNCELDLEYNLVEKVKSARGNFCYVVMDYNNGDWKYFNNNFHFSRFNLSTRMSFEDLI